jgi:hypothetical protein
VSAQRISKDNGIALSLTPSCLHSRITVLGHGVIRLHGRRIMDGRLSTGVNVYLEKKKRNKGKKSFQRQFFDYAEEVETRQFTEDQAKLSARQLESVVKICSKDLRSTYRTTAILRKDKKDAADTLKDHQEQFKVYFKQYPDASREDANVEENGHYKHLKDISAAVVRLELKAKAVASLRKDLEQRRQYWVRYAEEASKPHTKRTPSTTPQNNNELASRPRLSNPGCQDDAGSIFIQELEADVALTNTLVTSTDKTLVQDTVQVPRLKGRKHELVYGGVDPGVVNMWELVILDSQVMDTIRDMISYGSLTMDSDSKDYRKFFSSPTTLTITTGFLRQQSYLNIPAKRRERQVANSDAVVQSLDMLKTHSLQTAMSQESLDDRAVVYGRVFDVLYQFNDSSRTAGDARHTLVQKSRALQRLSSRIRESYQQALKGMLAFSVFQRV